MKTVAILATLDTKAAEADFMRSEIESLGGKALLIDLSLVGDSEIKADITKREIISAGGGNLDELLVKPNRERSNPFIVAGATKILGELHAAGKIDAAVSLGGTQGTSTCAPILQALPYGFPKVMLSTAASGDTSPFVGIKDITMMFAVSDILGLNVFSRKILANAAAAAWGMAQSEQCITKSVAKGVIGMSNLGVLTKGAMHAIELFEKAGYEVITFHAIGAGGDAMEQMMKEGIINAVFDYGLGEIADGVWGVLRAG
ncbi:Tm-1-like ATP-binding domain-containing protein, partial [bacterium]|nr:Tm-1-like ATP-binding domain-containing protein [bacterium]